jgi:hypothetical protein
MFQIARVPCSIGMLYRKTKQTAAENYSGLSFYGQWKIDSAETLTGYSTYQTQRDGESLPVQHIPYACRR